MLLTLLVGAFAMVVVFALAMWLVDPYASYHATNLRRRPAVILLDLAFAARLLRQRDASTVVIGTSDVLQGLASHPALLAGEATICGIQAGRMNHLRDLAIAAARKPATHTVVLALDLVSFGDRMRRAAPPSVGPLPGVPVLRACRDHLQLMRRTIFDRHAIAAALATLRDPGATWLRKKFDIPFELTYHLDGSASYDYLADDPEAPLWFLIDRHRHMPWLLGDFRLCPKQLDAFAALLRHEAFADTSLRLFIHPYHPAQLLLVEELGLWPALEQWKERLVGLTEATAGRVQIFDLTSFQVPWSLRPGQEDAAFIDSVHLTDRGGRELLSQLFPLGGAAGAEQLSTATLAAHLERCRADRDAYRARAPQEAAKIAALAAEPRRRPRLPRREQQN